MDDTRVPGPQGPGPGRPGRPGAVLDVQVPFWTGARHRTYNNNVKKKKENEVKRRNDV